MRKLSHEELVARQKVLAEKEGRLPFSVVLNNIRSLYNVGSIFRTADGAGVEKIWLCGITGIPPHPRISKTALGAEKSVLWEYRRAAADCLAELKRQKYKIILLEQTVRSISYENYLPDGPVCLVLGNEITGVGEELLPYYDAAVEIPMDGLKNSLNVTVAFGVVAYHFRNCLRTEPVVPKTNAAFF